MPSFLAKNIKEAAQVTRSRAVDMASAVTATLRCSGQEWNMIIENAR